MEINYDPVWQALHDGFSVLLLIQDEGDQELWEAKVRSVSEWFAPIVHANYGPNDLLMANGKWLCLRKSRGVRPPSSGNTKVMYL